jgi:hypothetical protein
MVRVDCSLTGFVDETASGAGLEAARRLLLLPFMVLSRFCGDGDQVQVFVFVGRWEFAVNSARFLLKKVSESATFVRRDLPTRVSRRRRSFLAQRPWEL